MSMTVKYLDNWNVVSSMDTFFNQLHGSRQQTRVLVANECKQGHPFDKGTICTVYKNT